MKKLTKILILCLACIMFFTGCSTNREGLNGEKINIRLGMFDGGYGIEWMKDIAQAYCTYYSTAEKQININVEGTVNLSFNSSISEGACLYDVVFQCNPMNDDMGNNSLIELTDIYNYRNDGDEFTIGEHIDSDIKASLNIGTGSEPRYKALPWGSAKDGLIANETVINEVLGEGTWEYPNTSDEFIALCDRIVAANNLSSNTTYYPIIDSTSYSYVNDCLSQTWWTQYSGKETYENYYKGKYTDGNDDVYLNHSGVVEDDGRKVALHEVSRLFTGNGYFCPIGQGMDIFNVQKEFCGHRARRPDGKVYKTAFMPNGDWIASESQKALNASGDKIVFLPVPVTSALGEKLGFSDAQLSVLIDLINGDKNQSDITFEYTPEQLKTISDARYTVFTVANVSIALIPSTTKNVAEVKKFLCYMYSKPGQKMYVQKLNGLSMPGDMNADALEVESSDFVKTVQKAYPDDKVIYIFYDYRNPLLNYGGLRAWTFGGDYKTCGDNLALFFVTKKKSGEFAYDNSNQAIQSNWQNICTAAGVTKNEKIS